MDKEKIIHKDLSYKINGLFFKVHKDLGRYRNEKQYCDYYEKLLIDNKINYKREYRFIEHQYGVGDVRCIIDFIIEDKIIVEFKAKDYISKDDYYQVKRYLVTLNFQLGIIINFRDKRIIPKRVLNSNFL